MGRTTKLTPEITKRIGDNVSFCLTFSLAAEASGITHKTLNEYMNKGEIDKSGKYFQFYKSIQKCNADAAKKCLERLHEAAGAETVTFACGFWRDVFQKTSPDDNIAK